MYDIRDRRNRTLLTDIKDGRGNLTIWYMGNEHIASLPVKYEVCEVCMGEGKYVNPGIDRNGITGDEWDRDFSHEMKEEYLSGGYDVTCQYCEGNRVVHVVDEERCDEEDTKNFLLHKQEVNDDIEYEKVCGQELRHGC